jgi:pilus assembly protein Flp/PilA
MLKKIKALFVEEQGQGMTEYGLILGLIALVVVGLLITMGGKLKAIFTDANTKMTVTPTN